MNKLIVLILLIFSTTLASDFAVAQCERWVPTNGPYRPSIRSLAIDPTTPSTLFAATPRGVYRSTDQGADWTPANTGLTEADFLVLDPRTPSTLYAASDSGVYRSTDQGANWTAVNNGLGSLLVHSLTIDPLTPSTLYAGTESGVYRSTDRGNLWTAINNGLTSQIVYSLAIDPRTPSTLYAGSTDGRVYRSIDRGANWTELPRLTYELWAHVFSLAINPLTPSTVYAGTRWGLFRTTDDGANWTRVSDIRLRSQIESLAVDPLTPSTIYASTGSALLRSTDDGATWTALLEFNSLSVVIDPATPSIVYAVGSFEVYRSTDAGANWTEISNVLTHDSVFFLVIDPSTPSTLYAVTRDGVYRSTDRGANWVSLNPNFRHAGISSLAIDPLNPSTIYAGGFGGVHRSTDGGATWTLFEGPLWEPFRDVHALAINPLTPSTIYAGRRSFVGHWGIFRSGDRGEHWSPDPASVGPSVEALAIDPVTPAIVYAGTWGSGVVRTEGGGVWTLVNNGLTNLNVSFLAIDPLTPSTIYAVTQDGAFRSTDKGGNWTALNIGPVAQTVFSLAINQGLTDQQIDALAIDPLIPSRVYGGGAGVFRLETDCGPRFSQFGNGPGLISDLVLTNPSPFNSVSGLVSCLGNDGLPLGVSLNGTGFSIPPLGALTLSTDGLGDLAVGSASVTADGAVGGVVRYGIHGIGIAGVGESEPVAAFITPVRRTAQGINTGIAISNVESQSLSLDLSLRDRQGQEVAHGHQRIETLPGGGHEALFIHELFPQAATESFEGTLVVRAEGGRIAAVALELGTSPGQFTTLPVTPVTNDATAVQTSFAQFGCGEGLTSDTLLVNPRGDAAVSGTLAFLDEEGRPMTVGLADSGQASSRAFSIPPLGLMKISTQGNGPIRVGSARVTADSPVTGVLRFGIPGIGIAGVGTSQPLSRLLIPVRRTAAGIRTGIALQNTSNVPVTIVLTLRDNSGATVAAGNATVKNLPAGGHIARFLEELFPEADTQNFQGTLSAEVTGGMVAATALELGSSPGEFTTLPVTPIE